MSIIGSISQGNQAQNSLQTTLARLASAKRLNSAADGAAELAIGNGLQIESDSLSQSMRNINDGIAMVQTADSGAAQISDNLSRMRELAMQSSNGTLNANDRAALQAEYSELASEVDRITGSTDFNGTNLLDGSTGSVDIQVGEDGSASSRVAVGGGDLGTAALGLGGSDISTQAGAQAALGDIDDALSQVNNQRSRFGASVNALESSYRNADARRQAAAGAASNILDTDYAEESANLARDQILSSVDTAVRAQANKLQAITASLIG